MKPQITNMMKFLNVNYYMDYLVSDYNVPDMDCVVYKNHALLFRYYTGKRGGIT